MRDLYFLIVLITMFFNLLAGVCQSTKIIEYIPAHVDFSTHLQEWDGFGFNYVEAAQTRDFTNNPQDYGGFSLLDEPSKQTIIDSVFGEDGLQVQIVKMFLDPWHQKEPEGPFEHTWTTNNMREFVKSGIDVTRKRNDDLEIITTLYGPPAWATRQKFVGGRDLDVSQSENLCKYMADWLLYLKENGFPVRYISLHNEGEDFYRWDFKEGTQRLEKFDYNMYWPAKQVNYFLRELPKVLTIYGLEDIKLTNGEPSNWWRFYFWDYTHQLVKDKEALNNLDLLTTHGFIHGDMEKLSYSNADDLTTGLLRSEKPGLHAWITSYSWGNMGFDFIRAAHEHIYSAKVNALIPWAGIQNPSKWIGGDPNPGTAIIINDDGSFKLTKGYYFYKQLTSAGKRGMQIAEAKLANPLAFIIAFAGNDSGNPDAFVVSSKISIWKLPIRIEVNGSEYKKFVAYRTTEDEKEKYKKIGVFEVIDGAIIYDPPWGSTTTFIGVE